MRDLILPPLRRTAQDAREFACIAHRGQRDKAGWPYTDHLSRVVRRTLKHALRAPRWTGWDYAEAEQIAWLHDVIEDTSYTANDLRAEGFSRLVVEGVIHLTKPRDRCEPYLSWVRSLCILAPLPALLVKLSDNEDNADPERMARLDEATRARLLAKYEPSMAMLREAARAKGWQG